MQRNAIALIDITDPTQEPPLILVPQGERFNVAIDEHGFFTGEYGNCWIFPVDHDEFRFVTLHEA